MPELRPRKPSAAKALPKEKTSSKRKAAAAEDASPIAPKKLKEDVQAKKSKREKRAASAAEPEAEEEQPVAEDDEDQAPEGEDEAETLAKVVDSDAEEEDASPDEDITDLKIPEASKDLVKSSQSKHGETGVVYIGRLPRGFFEHQMREYFSQFGHVTKIRMSRNKATGQSKHFAFIEFAELGVAEIVAKTMDNYLLAGHILKVKMVPKSQVHDRLWVGANKRFKKIPWNKMAGNRLNKPLSETTWTGKISKEETKRNERAKKLLDLGYEFEAPKLKSVHDKEDNTNAIEAAKEEEAPKAIEAAAVQDEAEAEQSPAAKKTAKKPAVKAGKKAKKMKKAV
ncbi:RNA-binding domain-containing protein [Astrocystis sublimbata]|nr:RNA-binding domain-containing protein [Astrocystis sublimbata]